MKYTIPFTKSGFEQFKKEYDDLQSKRPEIVKELSTARDMGDRSENAAYKGARRKLSSADSRLRFLKKIIEHAKICEPSQNEYVEIGSTVKVNNGTTDIVFYIVGEHEADPINKKLSYKSPVGSSLLRKKIGETCEVVIPAGKLTYLIKKIN